MTMDIESTPETLTLLSEEGASYTVNLQEFQRFSAFVSDVLAGQNLGEPVKCQLSSSQIESIITFINDRKDNYQPKPIQKPLISGNLSLYVNEIDYAYLIGIKSEKDLYLILKAAQFFHVNILTELIYSYIASMFIDKTNQELREKYGIQEQMTEQIDKEIKEKYSDLLNGTPFEESV